MYRLSVEHSFSAAHHLRIEGHKCENLHGHNWKVIVTVEGRSVNSAGMLIDFHDLKHLIHEVLRCLDHGYLNEIAPFDKLNPTTENICFLIAEKLQGGLPAPLRVYSVTVFESEGKSGTYLPG